MSVKIIGYYKESDVIINQLEEEHLKMNNKLFYFVVFENSTIDNSKKWFEGYNVLEGHFELEDKSYLISCEKISKNEYLKATEGMCTPKEYLN